MSYRGKERRQEVDNSVLYHKLGVVETKLDSVLSLSDDVESLKTSRTYGRAALSTMGIIMGFLGVDKLLEWFR